MSELRKIVSEINTYITGGNGIWREISDRITKIKERKLWAEEYESFEACVKAEWGKEKSWAYQLIQSRVVVEELRDSAIAENISVGAARALARVPREQRSQVAVAASANGPVTAKSIMREAEIVTMKKAKVIEEDEIGTVIPESALPVWHRRDEIKTMLNDLKGIRTHIMDRKKDNDPLFVGINQNCLDKLSLTINEIKSSVPEVVCGSCEGRAKEGCGACRHTWFQSKHDYERLTPEEDVKIRKTAIELRRKDAATRLPAAVPRLRS